MTTSKTEPTDDKSRSYQKPALRSEAFARAVRKAKLGVVTSGGLRAVFEKATKKAASLPRETFTGNWPYIHTMLRLIAAYERGDYKKVSNDDLTLILTALNYLIDPFDLIPDLTPVLGLVDDATVIGFAVDKTRDTLDDFMIWETTRGNAG